MHIVKNNQITEDNWTFVADGDNLIDGDITISIARLTENSTELQNHKGKIGVRLFPADTLEGIAGQLNHINLVELNFPDLADGRLFSLAWLLRNRFNYQGEIRATGNYIPEQVFYLSRVGVNSFVPNKTENLEVTLSNLNDFSVKYQPSVN